MKKAVVIDAFNFVLIGVGASAKANFEYYPIIFSMLTKLKGMFNNTDFYACWDEYGGTQFRKDIDENYKKGRSTLKFIKPEEIEELKSLFSTFDIKNISCKETEADDTIYCLCRILREKNVADITIISRDKDLIQVVQKGFANRIFDYVKKKYMEIPWYDIVLYKALAGDSSDHLIGVRGIGSKAASKIIAEYFTSNKLNLTEDQKTQFDRCRRIVDASLHPRLEENLTKLRNELI